MAAPKAVFDCMVFVQAAARHQGPVRACFDAAISGQVDLFVSPATLDELRDVLSRPELRRKFAEWTDAGADRFVAELLASASLIQVVPNVYAHPLDKKDEPYIDLAIAVSAEMIVSRDQRHMLSLMDQSTPYGSDFAKRFPSLKIISPEALLTLLRQPAQGGR
jgi:putative PIN family toxin of toxin-antitoxin system